LFVVCHPTPCGTEASDKLHGPLPHINCFTFEDCDYHYPIHLLDVNIPESFFLPSMFGLLVLMCALPAGILDCAQLLVPQENAPGFSCKMDQDLSVMILLLVPMFLGGLVHVHIMARKKTFLKATRKCTLSNFRMTNVTIKMYKKKNFISLVVPGLNTRHQINEKGCAQTI